MTENGFSVKGEAKKALAEVLNDTERVDFYRGYVDAAIDAVEQDQVQPWLPSRPCSERMAS